MFETQSDHDKLIEHGFRLKALDSWRRDEVDPRLGDFGKRLDGMSRADDIAKAVTERMQQQQQLRFTIGQKVIASLVGAAAIIGSLKGVIF